MKPRSWKKWEALARGLQNHINTGARQTVEGPGGLEMAHSAAINFEGLAHAEAEQAVQTTLLELVQTVGELTEDDREVVQTVVELLRSGRVRLIGNFRGQRLAEA